jgi:hypothetical protein
VETPAASRNFSNRLAAEESWQSILESHSEKPEPGMSTRGKRVDNTTPTEGVSQQTMDKDQSGT